MSGQEPEVRVRAEYDALRSTGAVHALARDVLAVSGPDAASYLQGQCSQDVAALLPGASAEALLLSPQGKVEAYVRVTRRGQDEFVIDTDAGFGPLVTARLERFRLRTKVTIEPLEWTCIAVRGPDARSLLVGQPDAVVDVAWPGLVGIDLLGPAPAAGLSDWVGDRAVRCGDAAWEAARIEAGVPVNGREVTEDTIAAEVGLVERTVSFTKGCFTGQELVARLDARGSKVARRLCGLVIGDGVGSASDGVGSETGAGRPAAPPVGAVVLTADQAHDVGHLSSVAWSPRFGTTVALATLHRRVSPPEAVQVQWTDTSGSRTLPAGSRPLPLGG
jgi:tRNA-modifying protein YgfZ